MVGSFERIKEDDCVIGLVFHGAVSLEFLLKTALYEFRERYRTLAFVPRGAKGENENRSIMLVDAERFSLRKKIKHLCDGTNDTLYFVPYSLIAFLEELKYCTDNSLYSDIVLYQGEELAPCFSISSQ